MAITKLQYISTSQGSDPHAHLRHSFDYILNPDKTEGGRYTAGINCFPSTPDALEEFVHTKQMYDKDWGRQGYHFILSFVPGEVDAETAWVILQRFAAEYFGNNYNVLYSMHTDQPHLHGHFVMNAVCMDGKKFRYNKGDWQKFIQPITNRLCAEYGLSTIELKEFSTNPEDMEGTDEQHKNYRHNEWKEKKSGKRSWSDIIRADVDECLALAPDYSTFVRILRKRGYEIEDRGRKYFAVRPPGKPKFFRLYQLGQDYTREAIAHRLGQPITDTPQQPVTSCTKSRATSQGRKSSRTCKGSFYAFAKTHLYRRTYVYYHAGKHGSRTLPPWKTRLAQKNLQQLQERIAFMHEHPISSESDFKRTKEILQARLKDCKDQKLAYHKKAYPMKPVYALVKEYLALADSPAAAKRKLQIAAELQRRGTSLSAALKQYDAHQNTCKENREKIAEARHKLKLLSELQHEHEQLQKKRNLEQQREPFRKKSV